MAATLLAEVVLLAWCTKHGIRVELRSGRQTDSQYDHPTKTIVASSRNRRSRLFLLIHEMGHAVLRNRTSFYLSSSPYVAPLKSAAMKLAVVHEEFTAWAEGRALARRLGIELDDRAFDRCRAACLRSYMEQYLYPHRYQ